MSMTVSELLADKASQAPNATLFTLGPEVGVEEAVALMTEKAISSVIVAEAGEMLGLITLREILAALNTQGGAIMQAKCRHVMKVNPPTAKPDDTVDHLRSLMTEMHITHVPVMNHDQLVGILSFYDIARSAIKDVAFENKLLKQYIKNWPANG
ncbi:MAG: CBS domain-containing protein [Rhodocyclaceae bacterium]|jgi:CBS domain-containing protein|nr:CBS domain-containing protein [Rhodocyclaceae bacterium]MCA3026378.1 CBS domain-containing protein [Rhodocyclaceae bacterium]MCA3032131.1 CBS domain-containing protein [Rhodocyclaceae bacterium]MCA3038953.1 CBS domain-containing protein [Rhodocyclaceae bacterium]MCA3048014.1 CBS domain-containing protein [Rhodocyclaceae bacterium]